MPAGASNSLWASHCSRFTDENSLVKRIFVWRLDGVGLFIPLNYSVKDHIENVAVLGADQFDKVSTGHKLSGKGKNAFAQLPSATAEMQGAIQEFNMLMNAATNGIKTAGQAASNMASKN